MPLQKVVAVQDDCCHWYVIPDYMQESFRQLNEIATDNKSTDEEIIEAELTFIDRFNQYRTNGDLNNIQLYADI